jgi:hypothetical protein
MDSLVSQYSRPAHTEEGPSEEEQLQLYSGTPELSLKFALPPVAQVRYDIGARIVDRGDTNTKTVSIMAPRNDGRLLQSQLPHQDRPRNYHPRFPLQGWYHRSHRLASHSRKLDSKSDSQEGH